jgi:hypothetical protein
MTVAVRNTAAIAYRYTVPARGWRPGRLRAVVARMPDTTAVRPAAMCTARAVANTITVPRS